MTLEEIIAEMTEKPDAQILLEWIRDEALVRNAVDDLAADIVDAINAYDDAIEVR